MERVHMQNPTNASEMRSIYISCAIGAVSVAVWFAVVISGVFAGH